MCFFKHVILHYSKRTFMIYFYQYMNVYRRFGFGGASSCHVIERMVVGAREIITRNRLFRVMVSYGELLEVINWLIYG